MWPRWCGPTPVGSTQASTQPRATRAAMRCGAISTDDSRQPAAGNTVGKPCRDTSIHTGHIGGQPERADAAHGMPGHRQGLFRIPACAVFRRATPAPSCCPAWHRRGSPAAALRHSPALPVISPMRPGSTPSAAAASGHGGGGRARHDHRHIGSMGRQPAEDIIMSHGAGIACNCGAAQGVLV